MGKPVFSIIVTSKQKENYEKMYNSLNLSSYCNDLEKKRLEEFDNKKNIIKQNEKMKQNATLRKKISKQKFKVRKLKKKLSKKITLPHSRLLDIPFEIVMVGSSPPDKVLPDNFRYIYSDTSLPRCLNIGVENACADYVLLVNDNMEYSELFLDTLYMFFSRIVPYMKKVLIIPRYAVNGVIRDDLMHLDTHDFLSPIIGKSCIFDKNMWTKLGGIDNTMIVSKGMADLQMKFYKLGYTPFVATISIVNEKIKEENE